MPRKKMWVEYPDGTELSDDRTVPGAKSALARGADKDLVTHAKLYDIPEDEDADVAEGDDDGDSPGVDPDLALLGGLALIGLTVGAVSAVGSAVNSARERKVQRRELEWRIAEARRADPSTAAVVNARMTAPAGWYDDGSGRLRWWDGQQWTEHYHVGNPRTAAPAGWYDDGSGRQRWWDGQEWTEHFQGSQSHMPIGSSAAAISGPTATAPSRDVEAAFATPTLSMSRAEWQERVRTMLMARAISDVQWRLLSNARIEDADSALLEWQKELRKLTPGSSRTTSATCSRTTQMLGTARWKRHQLVGTTTDRAASDGGTARHGLNTFRWRRSRCSPSPAGPRPLVGTTTVLADSVGGMASTGPNTKRDC